MFKWKDRNPNIKIIWSIGGWSYSKPFYEMAKTSQNRLTFIKSLLWWLDQKALTFIDGIDIDWEFPGGLGADFGVGDPGVDGKNYEFLIMELRSGLDKLAQKQKKYYELTTAIGVGPSQLRNWALSSKIKDIMPYL